MTRLSRPQLSLRPIPERAELLRRTGWAKGFSAPQILALAGHLESYTAGDGCYLIREGARNASLAIIVDGSAEVVKEDVSDRVKVLATLGPGQAFGEMAIIDGEPRSASVRATSETTLLILSRRAFERLRGNAPELAVEFILRIAAVLSNRLRQTSGALVEFLDPVE